MATIEMEKYIVGLRITSLEKMADARDKAWNEQHTIGGSFAKGCPKNRA